MATKVKVIRVSRDSVKKRREERIASQIRADGYIRAIEALRPIRINQNRGVML